MSDFFFNPAEEEGNKFGLLPAGFYEAEIVEATRGPPKTGDGDMLTFAWKILEGP
jgi:hypothetical protein